MDAVELWDAAIAAWELPDRLQAGAAPASPNVDVALSDRLSDEELGAQTPSRTLAREALDGGGTVLDVGCGAGLASLSLARRPDEKRALPSITAGRIVGVDPREDMLVAFAARAHRLGVAHTEIHGDWPDVAASAPVADVVVCHHVLYYVASLAPFVRALTAHARRRVVVEIPAQHPGVRLRPLWQHFHALERPTGPTVDDVVRALCRLGLAVEVRRWMPTGPTRSGDVDFVAHICAHLCLPAGRQAEVREMLLDLDLGQPLAMATLWWAAPHTASAA